MTIILSAQIDSFASTSHKMKVACLLVSATVVEVGRVLVGMCCCMPVYGEMQSGNGRCKTFQMKNGVCVFNLFKHYGKDVCGWSVENFLI